ncbi:F-box domain-containing protein [Diaporthe amygdali]|uniref:F-box domain-containing protein n=1 Tax=Phomopsis amygdali TaxID=1214568 RepID=UPI0022FDEC76|nr:F-box domain-containing protein [Diaporthe amygdali]KAJ0119231.1 F-box domain-containing protein [Diaporthe amygdali]
MTTIDISALPTEMLSHIFSFLDAEAPSDRRLHDQPHAHMLKDPDLSSQNLKNLSLVNKQWRATVLPLLFRNAVWYLDHSDLSLVDLELSTGPHSMIPLLSFVRDNNLTSYVKTLTLVVVKSTRVRSNGGDAELSRSGDNGYSPDPFGPWNRVGRERDMVFNEDSNWLWNLIFDLLDPLRFTIIASPRTLASLLARMLFLGDAWSFHQSHHVLSLSRSQNTAASSDKENDEPGAPYKEAGSSSPASSEITAQPSTAASSATPPAKRVPCALFAIRPWTSLLLNEGSSTRVYKTYEYYHRRPPSMLGALLGAEEFPNDEPLITPTIRDLSYVGIFPLSTHFNTLVQNLPRIDRLFVQLVPRNDILKDKKEMEHLDMDDLWAERNTSYSKIMPKLFDSSSSAGNWRHLQVFESGDAADRESWDMAVEYVRHFGAEWRVEREGVFVKRQPGETENDGDNEEMEAGFSSDDDADGPAFFGAGIILDYLYYL